MKSNGRFIVAVNGIAVAEYKGNRGSAYQVSTNHAYDIYCEYQKRIAMGETDYADASITVNGINIKEII